MRVPDVRVPSCHAAEVASPSADAAVEPATHRRRAIASAVDAAQAARAVLRQPRLRRVHGAWALAITADQLVTVVLTVFAYEAGGIAGAGAVSAVRAVPAAAAGPFVGRILDRFAEHRVLVASLTARVACTAALAQRAEAHDSSWLVYALAAADATAFTAYWPSQSVLLPRLATTAEELTASNATCALVEQVGAFVGPALAGLTLTLFGPTTAFAASAALLAAGIPLAARAGPDTSTLTRTASRGRGRLHAEGPRGARAALRTPGAAVLLVVYLGQVIVLGAMPVIGVLLATRLDGATASATGWFSSGVGAGGLVGSVAAFGFVGRRRLAAPVSYGLAVSGVAVASLAAGGGTAPGIALVAIVGGAGALLDVATLTLIQRTVRARDLAALMGVLEGLWCAASGLGALLAAWLAAAAGTRWTCGLLGAATGVLAATTITRLRQLDATSRVPERQLAALRTVPMFDGLPPLALERLALDLAETTFQPGACVIAEGDVGDLFYMIETGTADVVARDADDHTMAAGAWFGEIALIYDIPRTATVTAAEELTVLTLDREAFLTAMTARDARPHAAARVTT